MRNAKARALPKYLLAVGLVLAAAAGPVLAEQVLYSFQDSPPDGHQPEAPLVYAGGIFYGTNDLGGAHDERGTIFSLTPDGTETVLHSFGQGSDGAYPSGLLAGDGALYGTTLSGGASGGGTVFRLKRDGTEEVLHSFQGADGLYPDAALISVNGTLYGTTTQGGADGVGVVFSITPDGSETVLYSFQGDDTDGADPKAPLLYIDGTLYGTTNQGGTFDLGTIFSITLSGTETVLHSFGGAPHDGAHPEAGLTAVKGMLYGTTTAGGISEDGAVFSLADDGTEAVLYSFGGTDGSNPLAALINVKGVLYGTVETGTPKGLGGVFSITQSGVETSLLSFDGTNGADPLASLILVGGELYGTTSAGGKTGGGTVFSIK